jgi:hypothetical protein
LAVRLKCEDSSPASTATPTNTYVGLSLALLFLFPPQVALCDQRPPSRKLRFSMIANIDLAAPGNGLAIRPVNLGDARHGGALRPSRSMSPLGHWRRNTKPDFRAVIEGLDTATTAAAVFDNPSLEKRTFRIISFLVY